MSTASKGASRVASVERQFAALGFRYVRASASGRAGCAERRDSRIAGDLIAFAPIDSGLPHVIVEVGGKSKRLSVTFAEMLERPLPGGFVSLIARCVGRRWVYHLDCDSRFDSLADALQHARTA